MGKIIASVYKKRSLKAMLEEITSQHILFCPGPVNVAPNVKHAVVSNEIGHREQEFSHLVKRINNKLLELFQVKNKSKYHCALITGSGTAANEAILSSVVGDKHILILANGEFGNRLIEISSLHNKNTHTLTFEWGEKIDLKKVEQYIKNNPIDVIMMVHHETSTSMINPIYKVGALAKKHNKLFLVDTVSSAGAEMIDIEKANIAFCSTTASKAIGSMPGIGIVVGRKNEFEKLKNHTPKTIYLNLYKFYKFGTEYDQTPNTPAVQMFFALDQALSNILHQGMAFRNKTFKTLAKHLRIGMRNLGLEFIIDEKDMSCVLTTVKVPSYVDVTLLRERLRDHNIIIYNGKGPFLNKAFQVGNMGSFTKDDVLFFLQILEKILSEFKAFNKGMKKDIERMLNVLPNQHIPLPTSLELPKRNTIKN